MSPETKFHSIIVGVTVSIMFAALSVILPWVVTLQVPEKILAAIIALLVSAGAYGLLATGLNILLRKVRLLKRWILGPSYLEGTWVGYYIGHDGEIYYVVENYEQEFTSLQIQGTSYTVDGKQYAAWSSKSWNIDTAAKRLTYSYDCRLPSSASDHQGVAVFDLKRDSATAPATLIDGYSADLTNGLRSPALEYKVSNNNLDEIKSLAKAKEFAKAQGVVS